MCSWLYVYHHFEIADLHSVRFSLHNPSSMTKTTAYNIGVGLIVALGSFTYGFGMHHLLLGSIQSSF
jgi:hypothetical protein